MYSTREEIAEFIEENNVKFIRLALCDIYGNQKNISIMPNELEKVMEKGFPFDASGIAGFTEESSPDLYLYPDPDTMTLLPWRPSQGRVIRFFCNIRYADGTPFELDARFILSSAVERARRAGLRFDIGSECEFYLFKTNEEGEPTDIPLDRGTYMEVAPLDKGENIRREICLTLEEMGLTPQSSHHEEGPGQNEIDFRNSQPLCSADDVITLRQVVSTLASRNGLYASFAPKPVAEQCGNGYHINMALKGVDENSPELSTADSFIAGILSRICEMTAFLNPTEESYDRLGSYKAPSYVAWAPENRTQLIRVLTDANSCRHIDVRSPDSHANPYIALALLIHAGLDGVENKEELPPALNINMFKADKGTLSSLKKLPVTRKDAVELARTSNFIKKYLPEKLIEGYCEVGI